MKISSIFSVFSRREQVRDRPVKPLSPSFRNRVLLLCRDTVSGVNSDQHWNWRGDYTSEFWEEMHRKLEYLKGHPVLSSGRTSSQIEDAIAYLLECSDGEFLDFLELIFQTECYRRICPAENEFVREINALFEVETLPYYLTEFVRESGKEFFMGHETEVMRLTSRPQVVRREDEVLHHMAIEPAITFLAHKGLKSAHQEFLEALADYRKADYGDCLIKCGSAFESTMKMICERNRLPYKQTDTASTLLRTVLASSNLDPFFEQPLLMVATLRNRLSNAHGAGVQVKTVSQHIARYAVSSTAAAILLLVEELWQ